MTHRHLRFIKSSQAESCSRISLFALGTTVIGEVQAGKDGLRFGLLMTAELSDCRPGDRISETDCAWACSSSYFEFLSRPDLDPKTRETGSAANYIHER